MFNKPFFIAASSTVLACIPLYFLSTQEFTLTPNKLPIIALTLFILLLVVSSLSGISSSTYANDSTFNNAGAPRETGNVKWFNANKGFGFITRDNGDDIFVHFRSIRGKGHRVLHDGQRVEFAVTEGEKGLQAEDVAAVK